MTTAATPWGSATLVEEIAIRQRAGERRFSSHLQLLELRSGELLLRVAYASDGRGRRGPVTLRSRDLERLRTELESRPRLREALLGS
jgi:hypothetical protein